MKKEGKLSAPGYQYGSWERGAFRGYALYDYFDLGEFSLANRHGNFLFMDHWVEYLREQGFFSGYEKNQYEEDMKLYFQEHPQLWDLTNEGLYEAICRKRRMLFGEKIEPDFFQKISRKAKRRLLVQQDNSKEIERENCFVEHGIWQQAILERQLQEKCVVIIAVCELDWANIAFQKAKELLDMGKCVYMLLKGQSDARVITAEEFTEKTILNNCFLNEACTSGRLPGLLICDCDGFGFDFCHISLSEELIETIRRRDTLLLGFGEEVLLSIHDLALPSVVYSKAHSVYAKSVLNTYDPEALSIVYIPENFSIVQKVPVVEEPEITYAQYTRLADRYGLLVYEQESAVLKQRYPEYFVNLFSDRLERDSARLRGWEKKVQTAQTLQDGTFFARNCAAQRRMKGTGHGRSFFLSQAGCGGQIMLNGVIADSAQDAQVLRIQSYGRMSFRTYMRTTGNLRLPRYCCNFLFYFTPKLLERYNRVRADRPQEQLRMESFHLDYFQEWKNGEKRCTFPLFYKACIAKTQEGAIRFFHYRLGGGSLRFLDFTLRWEQEDVNPDVTAEREMIVYTPMLSQRSETDSPGNYVCLVGEKRLNLLIVGEKIVCIRRGSVMMPAVGVVISVDGWTRMYLEQQMGLSPDGDGYYPIGDLDAGIELDPPECIEASEWKNMQWAFGGGMMLIENYRSIFQDDPIQALREEGWLSPLSVQTQESSVHDESERHPRTLLGLCGDGRPFVLVFSGRNRLAQGVTYREACTIAMQYIPNIRYMMAVDGGASSFLGIAGDDTFMELSYPACSIENGTGTVRRVNSVFMI